MFLKKSKFNKAINKNEKYLFKNIDELFLQKLKKNNKAKLQKKSKSNKIFTNIISTNEYTKRNNNKSKNYKDSSIPIKKTSNFYINSNYNNYTIKAQIISNYNIITESNIYNRPESYEEKKSMNEKPIYTIINSEKTNLISTSQIFENILNEYNSKKFKHNSIGKLQVKKRKNNNLKILMDYKENNKNHTNNLSLNKYLSEDIIKKINSMATRNKKKISVNNNSLNFYKKSSEHEKKLKKKLIKKDTNPYLYRNPFNIKKTFEKYFLKKNIYPYKPLKSSPNLLKKYETIDKEVILNKNEKTINKLKNINLINNKRKNLNLKSFIESFNPKEKKNKKINISKTIYRHNKTFKTIDDKTEKITSRSLISNISDLFDKDKNQQLLLDTRYNDPFDNIYSVVKILQFKNETEEDLRKSIFNLKNTNVEYLKYKINFDKYWNKTINKCKKENSI